MPKGAIECNRNCKVVTAVEKIPFGISCAYSVDAYSHHIDKTALSNKDGTVVLSENIYVYAAHFKCQQYYLCAVAKTLF